MNSKVPSNSVIHDFGLLSKTQGRFYQKQEERRAALPEAFCFPISFHYLERVWSLHISDWDGSDLGVRLWSQTGLSKIDPGKSPEHQRSQRTQEPAGLQPASEPRTLLVGASPASAAVWRKEHGRRICSLHRAKKPFPATCLQPEWGLFLKGEARLTVGPHCHLLALCFFHIKEHDGDSQTAYSDESESINRR